MSICPAGYICDVVNYTIAEPLRMYSCEQLQQDVIDQGYGDILAGIYCKYGSAQISNCPSGHYCPAPDQEPIVCRAGVYCPAKSAQEDLYPCPSCREGATRYNIDIAALLIMILLTVVFPLFALFGVKIRNRKVQKLDSQWRNDKASVRLVQKMKSILKMIDERLGDKYICRLDKNGNVIGFDPDKLFDAIDTDNNGVIEYEELDRAMALTGDQLKMFVRRMNRAAGNGDNDTTIDRECFLKYFFETIKAASNFDPTDEDAKRVFDSIPQKGCLAGGEEFANLEKLYFSSLSTFLSDKQILSLVRLFAARIEQMDENIDEEEGRAKMVNFLLMSKGRSMKALPQDANIETVMNNKSLLYVTKENFVKLYPTLLHEMIGKNEEKKHPFDIYCDNLSLVVNVKGQEKAVVNKVTCRLRAGTMTALMGGSGAGKTSLLNALCGRAHYGETTGTIYINGKKTDIEECKDATGFVPQDDIMYAELTVKENLMFAGKIRLPHGTSHSDIEDLADEVIADLGLTRVSSSIVGDVTRRGVSGGEKKRVNIGLELMSKPSILFLDEPTSGLDSASAMTVMGSLYNLVRSQGMTVCTVIHQPRKQIFEMFDSLILLGVGGNMVYHGQSSTAKDYFLKLGYELGEGESIADWMIDISSGELSPSSISSVNQGDVNRNNLAGSKASSDNSSAKEDDDDQQPLIEEMSKDLIAASNRDRLYTTWCNHFKRLVGSEKELYMKPVPSPLPPLRKMPGFPDQVWNQINRCALLFKRNIHTKILETLIIIVGIIVITLIKKPLQLNEDIDPGIPSEYFIMTSVGKDPSLFEVSFNYLFRHTIANARNIISYGSQISTITGILVTLSTAKVLLDKRVEFYREAASGYNINAYFLAVVLFNFLEITVKMILASLCAYALRNSAANPGNYILQFILFGWVSSAWGFLIVFLVPTQSVVLICAFYTIFANLLLSGAPGAAITYSDIYRSSSIFSLIAGLFSPNRFFLESMSVNEFRSLEVQQGFTNLTLLDDSTGKLLSVGFDETSLAINSPNASEETRSGWFWGIAPCVFVGFTVRLACFIMLQLRGRKIMLKKPIQSDKRGLLLLVLLFVVFGTCLGLSIFFFRT